MQNSSELHQQKIMPFMWYSKVITRAALDQRSTSANKTVEEAWRNTSAHRVNQTLLREI